MANAAVRFDASADKYSRSAAGLGASAFTVCCWIKIQVDRNAFGGIIAADDGGGGYQTLGVNASGTALGTFSSGGDTFQTAGTFDLTVGTWTFIARVFTPSASGHVYIALSGDSSLTEATNPPGGAASVSDTWTWFIGNDGFGDWMNASVAAVKVWTAALTTTELLAEMPYYSPVRTSNLWANYTFYNGTQTNDESGNGRTLTAGGTVTTDSSGPPISLSSGPTSYNETGRSVAITAGVTSTDTLFTHHYNELGLSVPIVAAITVTDTFHTHFIVETGLSIPIVAGVTSTDTFTHVGASVKAVVFDAIGETYSRSASGLNTSTSITWCCWAKLASDRNTSQTALGSDDGGTNYVQMGAGSSGTQLVILSTVGGTPSSYDFPLGTWVFIAATMDIVGSNDWLYHAASPATTLTGDFIFTLPTGWNDSNTFYIGNNGYGGNGWFDGSIAQVKVWTRALTQAQLEAEMYVDGVVGTANLWAYYSFRNGPQTNDESGNGRILTAVGTLTADPSGPFSGSSSNNYNETGRSVPVTSVVTCTDTLHAISAGWQAAVDSGNLATMQAWYAANCGYLAQGWLESQMWGTAGANITVTSSWLIANAAAGKVVNDGGGHWTITGLRAKTIVVQVSHITFRHCHVDTMGDLPNWGVMVVDPATGIEDACSNTDIRFEYCTVESGGAYNISNKQLTSNVATLTYTPSSFGTPLLTVGQTVEIRLIPPDPTFDAIVETVMGGGSRVTITAVTPTTFSYSRTHANVVSTPCGGYATTFIEGEYGDVVYYDPADSVAVWNGMVWEYCIGKDFVAAFKLNRGSTINYCWVPRLIFFGIDPHNTSSSIRGRYCRLYRNLFEDGTSSAVSCYADNYPYTEFEIHENIMHAPTDYTVNFPARPIANGQTSTTNWHLLENGFRRELVSNYIVRGNAGFVDDVTWFTKTFNNRLLDGTPVPDLMDEGAPSISTEPHLIKSCWNIFGGGLVDQLDTWAFTPSPNSTLFLLAGIVQGGHTTVQTPSLSVVGQYPQTFTAVANTPLQNAPGADPNHGMRIWLYKAETGGTTSFEHIHFDPYSGTQSSWVCYWVYEVTGITGMNLIHSSVSAVTGADTITTTALSGASTAGHLAMAFCAASVDDRGVMSNQTGWTRIGTVDTVYGAGGNEAITGAMYWRKDFTGTTFTVSDLGNSVHIGAVVLTEYDLPGVADFIELNLPVAITAVVSSTAQVDFHEVSRPAIAVVAAVTSTDTFTHIGHFDETLRVIPVVAGVSSTDLIHRKELLPAVPVVAAVFSTDKMSLKELARTVPCFAGIITPVERAHLQEHPLFVSIVTGVSSTDVHAAPGHFDETLRIVAVTAGVSTPIDRASLKDSRVVPIVAGFTVTDSPRVLETNRSVAIVAAVNSTARVTFRGLGLTVPVVADMVSISRVALHEPKASVAVVAGVSSRDVIHNREQPLSIPITAAVNNTSVAAYHQPALSVPVVADVAVNNSLHAVTTLAVISILSNFSSTDTPSRAGVVKLNDADVIRLGTKVVSRVYVGATQVWP